MEQCVRTAILRQPRKKKSQWKNRRKKLRTSFSGGGESGLRLDCMRKRSEKRQRLPGQDGKNFVGRADDMDIQILGDNKIARRNHAVIVFDAKKRENMILPGDSNGLVYLNGEAVYLPQPLSAYDVIEMGESTFLFVPFCGEHYMWEDDK